MCIDTCLPISCTKPYNRWVSGLVEHILPADAQPIHHLRKMLARAKSLHIVSSQCQTNNVVIIRLKENLNKSRMSHSCLDITGNNGNTLFCLLSVWINSRLFQTYFIHPSAAHSLFLRDWEGDDEVVLLAPPSSSSLGSVFISGFLSSTSIGSGFSSGSSFFTSVDTESSSVYGQKGKWLTFSFPWQSDQLCSQIQRWRGVTICI